LESEEEGEKIRKRNHRIQFSFAIILHEILSDGRINCAKNQAIFFVRICFSFPDVVALVG